MRWLWPRSRDPLLYSWRRVGMLMEVLGPSFLERPKCRI